METALWCYLCKTPSAPMHCDICDKPLCKTCVGEHLSDESKVHRVVSTGKRGSTSMCKTHSSNVCELYCEECEIPICALCVSSRKHQTHKLEYILESLKRKKNVVQKDLQDLENSMFPEYQMVLSNIPHKKDGLNEKSNSLKQAIKKYGDELHKEVDTIIQQLKYDLDEIHSKQLAYLEKKETEIADTISEIRQCIDYVKKVLASSDVSLVFSYKTRNDLKFPPELADFCPRFTPPEINKGDIYKYFGSPSVSSIRSEEQKECGSFESLQIIPRSFQTDTEEQVHTMEYPSTWSSPRNRPLIGVPQIISEIKTDYESKMLHGVAYLRDGKIWTCGGDAILRLYNLKGHLKNSVITKPMNKPWDIAVKKSGDLIYTDYKKRSVNLVNTDIQALITLNGWAPYYVCSTSTDELLVVMVCNKTNQTQVVRYSGINIKQTIQYSDDEKPLYSNGFDYKYISENRNLDICVSDNGANAVVVVNQAGKFRYRYHGIRNRSNEFHPYGITTDSQSRVLTADWYTHHIHILDQDGQFLRFIDNCQLKFPCGLCVDTKDNLFVAEHKRGTVKQIQY